jgi:hypothetical protein
LKPLPATLRPVLGAGQRQVIEGEQLLVLLQRFLGQLVGDADDRRVVLVGPRRTEACTQHFKPRLFDLAAGERLVGLELLEQRLLALLLQVLRLVRVGHIPAVLGLGHQRRVVLVQAAQILVVGREVAVDLARHIASAVVLQEVVFQQLVQFRNDLALALGRADLRDVLRVNLRSSRWALEQEVGQPVDGTALVGNEQLRLRDLRNTRPRLFVLDQLLGQEHHAIRLTEADRQLGQKLRRRDRHHRAPWRMNHDAMRS